MKYKILIALFVIVFLVLSSGLTYSYFNSDVDYISVDQKIASFIFDTETLDRLELPLIDLKPGQVNEYNFSVSNTKETKTSDVTILYQLTILTPHFTPLIIEVYKGNELVMTCDENYSRNANNELVCNTDVFELSHSSANQDDYKLKLTFDSRYDDLSYTNLIDYINIEIKSYQKV